MKPAVFFQKYGDTLPGRLLIRFWIGVCLKTNKARIKYLRDAGAIIGDDCSVQTINTFGSEPYLITVGNHVYFTGSAKLITHDGSIMQLKHMGFTDKACDYLAPIKIGDNCFIGEDSIILKGVTIGKNCIVGAGAIVTKSFPDGSVIAGVPAKMICTTEAFFKKNELHFSETCGMNRYAKRLLLQEKFGDR